MDSKDCSKLHVALKVDLDERIRSPSAISYDNDRGNVSSSLLPLSCDQVSVSEFYPLTFSPGQFHTEDKCVQWMSGLSSFVDKVNVESLELNIFSTFMVNFTFFA